MKPGHAHTPAVEVAAESVGLAHFEQLAAECGYRITVIVDALRASVLPLGRSTRPEVIYAHLDAVDGTIKVGGLGNDLPAGRLRIANDGSWGVAMAFTAPTRKRIDELVYADFGTALIVDGNPPRYRAFPHEVAVVPTGSGQLVSLDLSDAPSVSGALRHARHVFTTSNEQLAQSVVYWDAFQAFDRATHAADDEALVPELYGRLANRLDGGPYDIVRQYGNLSALLRVMLGWRDGTPWVESQGAGFVVVNENLPNLIPAIAVIAGAGGISVDFDNQPLLERRLIAGRTSVVHAANEPMRAALLGLVSEAQRRVRERAVP